MAGPGAISLVIVDAHQMTRLSGWIFLRGGVIVSAFVVLIALSLAEPIGKRLGLSG